MVPVVQMGEEEEKTWAVPRAVVSTVPVVLWAGAAHKSTGAVERELLPCFPFHS